MDFKWQGLDDGAPEMIEVPPQLLARLLVSSLVCAELVWDVQPADETNEYVTIAPLDTALVLAAHHIEHLWAALDEAERWGATEAAAGIRRALASGPDDLPPG